MCSEVFLKTNITLQFDFDQLPKVIFLFKDKSTGQILQKEGYASTLT